MFTLRKKKKQVLQNRTTFVYQGGKLYENLFMDRRFYSQLFQVFPHDHPLRVIPKVQENWVRICYAKSLTEKE